jgi:hypothetical protein
VGPRSILTWLRRAIELTGSVYRVPTLKQLGPYADLSAKLACITIPILQIGLKLIQAVYTSMTAYVVVINTPSKGTTSHGIQKTDG